MLVCAWAYYGGFRKVAVAVERQGGEVIAYESVKGDYSNTPKYTDKIYNLLLNDDKVATTKGIGIFYDNPKNVAKDELRSDVGCVIDAPDSTLIARLSAKYNVKTLPEGDFVVAEFPIKGAVSYMVGIMKVYPAMNKYAEAHGLKESPITEIYDIPNKRIIYRQEVVK